MHFDGRLDPGDVAWKAVAVSISDLAAMGAYSERLLLTLAHPGPDAAWMKAFADGLAAACGHFEVDLVGGDTTRADSCCVGVTALGRLRRRPLTRSGARPGDRLYVAGTLGLAGAGYRWEAPPAEALRALRRPEPPVGFALALAELGLASAAMDASDGAASDLPRLAHSSGVCIELEPRLIPVAEVLVDSPDLRELLLGAGDDYALWFTSSEDAADLQELGAQHGVCVSAVGRVLEGEGAHCTDGSWPVSAWQHFGGGS